MKTAEGAMGVINITDVWTSGATPFDGYNYYTFTYKNIVAIYGFVSN
jgi:hypothetical protein